MKIKFLVWSLSFFLLFSLTGLFGEGIYTEEFRYYPIKNSHLTGHFEGLPSADILFHSGCLLDETKDDGRHFVSTLEKSQYQDNYAVYLLSLKIDNKTMLYFTVQIEFKFFNKIARLVYFEAEDAVTGQSTVLSYNGTDKSLGEVLGGFLVMSEFMFDIEKVNKILNKRRN